jgi:hypothetical protein
MFICLPLCKVPAQYDNDFNNVTMNGSLVTQCCSGLCIDLLRKFEDELGFSYDLVRVEDPKWGTFEVR